MIKRFVINMVAALVVMAVCAVSALVETAIPIGLAVGFGSYYAEVYHDAYIADQVDQAEKRFDTWQQKMLKDANPGARSKDYHKDQDGKVVPNDGEVL